MRKLLLCLALALALAACQPLDLNVEPFPVAPERRGQVAPPASFAGA